MPSGSTSKISILQYEPRRGQSSAMKTAMKLVPLAPSEAFSALERLQPRDPARRGPRLGIVESTVSAVQQGDLGRHRAADAVVISYALRLVESASGGWGRIPFVSTMIWTVWNAYGKRP